LNSKIEIGTALSSAREWISILPEDGIFVPYLNGLLGNDFAKVGLEIMKHRIFL
jgi:hypothetical protein